MIFTKIKNWNLTSKIISIFIVNTTILVLFIILFYIPVVKNRLISEKKESVKKVVDVGYSMIKYHYEEVAKSNSTRKIQQELVMSKLKKISYELSNYYWILNDGSFLLMHPFSEEIVGTDTTKIRDINGVNIFKEFVKTSRNKKGGFVSYFWPKPNQKIPLKKISYVKLFKPWKWIIGSGVYIDDIEIDIRNTILILLGGMVLLIMVSIIYFIIGNKKILCPLLKTSEIMRKYGKIEEEEIISEIQKLKYFNNENEIGNLLNSFNKMIKNILEYKKEIKSHHDHLELLVAKRSKKLKESEERFRAITEKTKDIIVITDRNENIKYVSPSFLSYGYSKKEIIGQTRKVFLYKGDYEKTVEIRKKSMLSPNVPIKVPEIRLVDKDGAIIYMEGYVTAMFDQAGIEGLVFNGWDISERKLTEELVRQSEEILQETSHKLMLKAKELKIANDELSQYAYIVSHDLKAPLRAIHNYSDFLKEDLEDTLSDEHKSYLEGIISSVKQRDELISDLLIFSQIGKKEIKSNKIKLSNFIKDLIFSLKLPDDIEIKMHSKWPTVKTVPTLLQQIIVNLLTNAIKFNNSQKKIVEIGYDLLENGNIEIYIKDNGIGIDLKYQEKIFKIFQRLHTHKEFEGTGIGLAIIKKALVKMGGDIRVESKLGKGSTFFITFPQR